MKIAFLPPMFNILLLIAGLLLLRRWPKIAWFCLVSGVVSLYAFSTPWFADRLLLSLERHPAITLQQLPQLASQLEGNQAAVVVLGSGHDILWPQYGEHQLDERAVTRINYASWLSQKLAVPLLLTGGPLGDIAQPHSEVMAKYMQQHLKMSPDWLEVQSRTTYENALYAKEILDANAIDQVVLVTHSYHMPRAVKLFEARGISVIPAPIETAQPRAPGQIEQWLPYPNKMLLSSAVIHEYLGLLYYSLRGFL